MTEEERTQKKVDEAWKREVEKERLKAEASKVLEEVPATFQFLITSLGMEAIAFLQERHLPQARHVIDLLTLLKEKTKGNLTQEESKALEELCYTLKLKYVEKAGG